MKVKSERERVNGSRRDNRKDILCTEEQIKKFMIKLLIVAIVLSIAVYCMDYQEYLATGEWPFHC